MTTALRLGTAALLLIFATSAAATPVTPATQPLTLDGMTIYVGVLPAAMITEHAPARPEPCTGAFRMATTSSTWW